ncbi:hypothetical protein SAMN05421810_10955 [Amycolatopsis arida]|uniref:Uncharacterized protein n=1 Tax=Amycolatopsis arida TaxID=587909 RepID=A0A1I5ZCY4_9PSEU|nr:hypothetical protein CLV69_10954 [Amycolatopsis arida]SFQ54320.1 hypothetical protein SAMN05421810_10955 [Amycolatopsis arida]
MPSTNTVIVAAPTRAEPEANASASTDNVTPHGMSTVARPSSAGASAARERARLRTILIQEIGGSMTMPRKPGTPS